MYNVNALEINLVTCLPNVKISFGLSRPILSHWRCMSPTGSFLKIFWNCHNLSESFYSSNWSMENYLDEKEHRTKEIAKNTILKHTVIQY